LVDIYTIGLLLDKYWYAAEWFRLVLSRLNVVERSGLVTASSESERERVATIMSLSKIAALVVNTTAVCSRTEEIKRLNSSIEECRQQLKRYNDRKRVVQRQLQSNSSSTFDQAELKLLVTNIENSTRSIKNFEDRKRVVSQKLSAAKFDR
jgi:hypothetical protein